MPLTSIPTRLLAQGSRLPGPPFTRAGAGTAQGWQDSRQPSAVSRQPRKWLVFGHRGFTAVELLLSSAVLAAALAAILGGLTAGQRLQQASEASLIVQQAARQALTAMTRELRDSGNVNVPSAGKIDFQLAQSYGGAGITWGDGQTATRWVHYLRAAAQPQQLTRCTTALRDDPIDPNACRVLANGVTAFIVSYDNPTRLVSLQLDLQQALQPGSSTVANASLKSLVYRRYP